MEYNKELQTFQRKAFYVSPANGIEIRKKAGSRTYRFYPYGSECIYNVHNNIVYWQNAVGGFIHPSVNGLEELLENAGYRKENYSVPCSHKEQPVNSDMWSMLLSQAEQEYRENFLEECKQIADEKNIKTLPTNFLWNCCFEIPISGISATRFGKDVRIYPYAHIMLDYVPHLIGLYNTANGFTSFVDPCGRMFVTTVTHKHIELLTEAGYVKDDSIIVPFSNGEVPTAMLSRCKWENICNQKNSF